MPEEWKAVCRLLLIAYRSNKTPLKHRVHGIVIQPPHGHRRCFITLGNGFVRKDIQVRKPGFGLFPESGSQNFRLAQRRDPGSMIEAQKHIGLSGLDPVA